jgi:signal transduction histidine kinase
VRLADFISANTDPILREWDSFARSIWPAAKANPLILRDHAEAILRAAVVDMRTGQTAPEQMEKSKGDGSGSPASAKLDTASKKHALARVKSGFDLIGLVAEYRALRASVVRLWSESGPDFDSHHLVDLTRFNESIDQSLTEAVRHFSEQVDHSREIFLGILGHDLRNPLNAMLLSAQSLAEISEGESAMLASQIVGSGEAMARLLADFLDFTGSRLGRGIAIKRAPVDLAMLCREVVEESRTGLPSDRIRLELTGNLAGEWDAGRLRQVLSNLIGNATQHGSDATPIFVSVAGQPTEVVLRVQNAGEPIAETDLPTIFDPLVQGPTSESKPGRRSGSMGLGLYIAREVVNAHGGTISVTSNAMEGTVFTVSLPRHGDTPRAD